MIIDRFNELFFWKYVDPKQIMTSSHIIIMESFGYKSVNVLTTKARF